MALYKGFENSSENAINSSDVQRVKVTARLLGQEALAEQKEERTFLESDELLHMYKEVNGTTRQRKTGRTLSSC